MLKKKKFNTFSTYKKSFILKKIYFKTKPKEKKRNDRINCLIIKKRKLLEESFKIWKVTERKIVVLFVFWGGGKLGENSFPTRPHLKLSDWIRCVQLSVVVRITEYSTIVDVNRVAV